MPQKPIEEGRRFEQVHGVNGFVGIVTVHGSGRGDIQVNSTQFEQFPRSSNTDGSFLNTGMLE